MRGPSPLSTPYDWRYAPHALRGVLVGGRGFCLGAEKSLKPENACRRCRRIPHVWCTSQTVVTATRAAGLCWAVFARRFNLCLHSPLHISMGQGCFPGFGVNFPSSYLSPKSILAMRL